MSQSIVCPRHTFSPLYTLFETPVVAVSQPVLLLYRFFLTDGFSKADLVRHYCLLPKVQIHLFTRPHGVTLTPDTDNYQLGLHTNRALRRVHKDRLQTEYTALGLTQMSVSDGRFRRCSLFRERKECLLCSLWRVLQLGKWQERGRVQCRSEHHELRVI